MCSYRVKLAVKNGYQPQPIRHQTLTVTASGPLEAASRAEDLCNVLLDRDGPENAWAQACGIERIPDHPVAEAPVWPSLQPAFAC